MSPPDENHHSWQTRPRRWLQFSLRKLLITLLVIFSFFGYCADRIHRQRASVAAIKKLGGNVLYVSPADRGFHGSEQLAEWLGRDTVARVRHVFFGGCPIQDDDLACLAGLPHLDTLTLTSTPVTDEGLIYLGRLKHLSFVDLRFTQVTTAGVERLRRCLPHTKIVYRSDID